MSPKQWFALLCIYVLYLFFGASIFYYIEHTTELRNRAAQLQERISVNELLVKYASPEDKQTQDKVLQSISDYCSRPVTNYTLDEYPVDYEWTFFHSFWFSFITCSTVGYGNSSPHDQPGQAFLIFYALIGLPLNGFVLAYLGEFFTQTVKRIYNRYKGKEYSKTHHRRHRAVAIQRFGLIGSIAMFLVPGITFFIFLPACLFMYFEDWPYIRSVYYSFVTLTTIGFGDYVPTFQDGQARKFGAYFTAYQIFIIFWNVIGVGYFIMLIGFIAKGMQSKRVAHLEHQISMNIKETQNRIWSEVTKDVNILRRILNEAHLMKFRPVYTDPAEVATSDSIRRSSTCPQFFMYANEDAPTRKRAYSENSGQLSDTSIQTLNRTLSDGDVSRIDRTKTFEDSDSLFQTNDLLSNVLTALDSIRQTNDDVHSCSDICGAEPDYNNEWTRNGNNSEQLRNDSKNKSKRNSISSTFGSKFTETLKIPDESESQSVTRTGSFISRLNPFKNRSLSQEHRRSSVISQDYNLQNYLENTSKRRESLISVSQFTSDNMELLENTTIADLIRAIEGEAPSNRNISPGIPLLAEYNERSRINVGSNVMPNRLRKGSLRPTHDYTTIFTSNTLNLNRAPALLSKSVPVNSSGLSTPRRPTKRMRSTSSTIPTVHEHYTSDQSMQILHRTMSLRPTPAFTPVLGNTNTQPTGAAPQVPMITLQSPNVTKRNLLWHPEYRDKST